MPYLSQPTFDTLTASQLSVDHFRLLGSLDRTRGAPENDINIEAAEISQLVLPNSSYHSFYLGLSVAAPSSTLASQRQQSSPARPDMATTFVLFDSTPVPFTVVEPPTRVAALLAIGLPPTMAPPSESNFTGVSSAVPLFHESRTSRVFPSYSPFSTPLAATTAAGFSISQRLTTIEHQRDAALRNLAAFTPELHKVRGKNDEQDFF